MKFKHLLLKDLKKNFFEIDLRTLALFRICMGLLILCDLFNRGLFLKAHYTDFGVLPRAVFLENFSHPFHFSILFANGTFEFILGFFILFAICSFFLLIGFKTRWMALICWFFLCSLQVRNTMVLQGGDVLFRMLLFWNIFLPSGQKWSFDAWVEEIRNPEADKPSTFIGVSVLALKLQLVFMYVFTAILKSGNTWTDGTASFLALSLDHFRTPFGDLFLGFPELLKFLTFSVWYWELLGPLIWFFPFIPQKIRIFGTLAFIFMHQSFGAMLEIGLFHWICSAGLLCFLPSEFWDLISKKPIEKSNKKLKHFKQKTISSMVCLSFLVFTFLWNMHTLPGIKFRLNPRFINFGILTEIEQKWDMFAPNPMVEDGWFVMPAKFRDNNELDLFSRKKITFKKPKSVVDMYPNQRWRKYLMNLWSAANSKHRLYYGRYLCRSWNLNRQFDKQLLTFKIYYMKELSTIKGPKKPEKVLIWTHNCFG